jgi:hypothetical protein
VHDQSSEVDVFEGTPTHFTRAGPPIKRSDPRRLVHNSAARQIPARAAEKKFLLSGNPQEMHVSSTGFQQVVCMRRPERRWRDKRGSLDGFGGDTYA